MISGKNYFCFLNSILLSELFPKNEKDFNDLKEIILSNPFAEPFLKFSKYFQKFFKKYETFG